jgi:hypothetical protein
MIMVFVILVMLLTTIMGLIIMVGTKNEVASASHYRQGREAFNSADSAIRIANLFGRVLLNPVLGSISEIIKDPSEGGPKLPLTVEVNAARLKVDKLIDDSDLYEYLKRYVETGISNSSSAPAPHIVFKIDGEEVATAVVAIGNEHAVAAGFSRAGTDRYDQTSGGNLPVDLIITVKGNTVSPAGQNTSHSMITTIMRELL